MVEENNDNDHVQEMASEGRNGNDEAEVVSEPQNKKKVTKRKSSTTKGKRKSKVKSSTSAQIENGISSLDFGEDDGGGGSSRSFNSEGGDETTPNKKKSTTKKKRKSSIKTITAAAAADGDESDVDGSSRSFTVEDGSEEKQKSLKKKKKKKRRSTNTTALNGSASLELGGDESGTFSVDEDGATGEDAAVLKKKTKKKRKSSIAKTGQHDTTTVDETDEENVSADAEGSSRSFNVAGGDGEKSPKNKKKKKKRKSSILAVAVDDDGTTTDKEKKDADRNVIMPINIDYDSSEEFPKDDLGKIEALNTDESNKKEVAAEESSDTPERRKSSELLLKYNEFWSQRGIVEKVKLEDIEDNQKKGFSYEDSEDDLNGFLERQSKRIAKSPCIHFWTSLVFSIVLAMIGLIVGEFSVSASTGGWQSRGTMVADRQTQFMMVDYNKNYLFYGGEDAWKDLIDNVQSGWEDDDDGGRRQLRSTIPMGAEDQYTASSWVDYLTPQADRIQLPSASSTIENPVRSSDRPMPFHMTESLTRRLQDQFNSTNALANCDISEYDSATLTMSQPRLWPIWKTQKKGLTALSPEAIYDICVAETKTQMYLEENDLCYGCDGTHDDGRRRCLPPYSLVLFTRLTVESNGMDMSCEELRDAWAPYQADTEEQFKTCILDLKAEYDPSRGVDLPESCPPYFSTTLVDETFEVESMLKYTSSVFVTRGYPLDDLFDGVDSYDRGGGSVLGAYDTQWENFVETHVDNSLVSDMALAMGSAIVVALAIVVHTKSLFITLIGLLQIILSFPLAYFVYKLVAGLDFFPFLNFIGVFVLFALGADDVFVAVDKWKNARIAHPNASTEYVAAVAFPDAAGAMCLTTLTTAIAFFATAICPVAPVKMFAIFVGLLVMFDYLMNVLLVFPALCIYDRAIQRSVQTDHRPNMCITWACCHRTSNSHDDEKPSWIHRILSLFYAGLHSIRWVLFVVCIVAIILSAIFAAKLDLPTSSDVRLLPDDQQFEQNFQWKKRLLWSALDRLGGSRAHVIWGLSPADTGIHGDPTSWSQLVLDPSFDPSSEDSQIYMTQFCDDLYDQEFATQRESNYTCPMQVFDGWLQRQSQSDFPDEIYNENCNGASGIPVPREDFHSCIVAWTEQVGETSILSRNGEVKIMFVPFASRVRYDNHYDQLDTEWKMIEKWMDNQNSNAPKGVDTAYFTSFDFWWYDTNGAMLKTAYSSAAIALGAASAVVLFSSRSFVLTIFSTLTIGYVLCSVTATLVSLGWTLGFLESICFAILIGISVDFVIHFGHAYSAIPGIVSRNERTKHALINMGPSILAAAFTTMSAAIIMLFCVITFFSKFALILFMTVIQASAGSFVVFLVFNDCIGPSQPTYLVDKLLAKISGKQSNDEDSDKPSLNDETERTTLTNTVRKLSSFFDA